MLSSDRRRRPRAGFALLQVCLPSAALAACGFPCPALAEAESAACAPALPASEAFAIHGQATYVEQETDGFHAPYSGPQSLSPDRGRETVDVTLYLGARLWPGAEAWLNPEIDQGFGLDDTLGVAAFPSAEAYKVGHDKPYLRLPRGFIRETLTSGAATEAVQPQANQLGGSRGADRWVITVGKFGVTDVFDTNAYAHDQRADFLNWAAVDAGSLDYAADAWGFTVGAAAERYLGAWTFRLGLFDLSNIPNSTHLDPGFHEFQWDGEIEKRYALFGQEGRALVTVFDSRGRMGRLDEAVELAALTGGVPDPGLVRQYRSRLGASFNVEQPVSADLGVFARVGKAAGNVETYEFTDIDRSIEVGASLKGARWHRSEDTVGVAFLNDGISAERERFLNAGGLGLLIGDGRLPHPGPEQVIEVYYDLAVRSFAHVALDYQGVRNPAYNTDRGPVSVGAVRVHLEF